MWNKIRELKKFDKLDFSLYRFLIDNFGKRGDKAFFYVKEERVKKYRDFFVVVGNEEYIVDDEFCTCRDFQLNLKGLKPCAHIIAVHVARNIGNFDVVDAYYIDFTNMGRRIRI
ncbi:SWIM zinc finger family protein [Geoglobus acetivorans]|uniref:SWIM-type domain-containing protein n=1 Tax=Geoglobus acetivorans TaxID=565033 RepID=A0A0A7GF89_GEOAI|nr:hypothetical protein GACE_0574 [Geoglobus acetivorans]